MVPRANGELYGSVLRVELRGAFTSAFTHHPAITIRSPPYPVPHVVASSRPRPATGHRINRARLLAGASDEQTPAPTGRRTATALAAAANRVPTPEPEVNLSLVYTISIFSGALVDASGAITRPQKLETTHSGTCRWRSTPGFARFKTAVGIEATLWAKVNVGFEDVDVKVEIPGSIYNQRTPCSPINQANYLDMVNELQRNGGRPGRLVLKWTRPPSPEVDTGASALARPVAGSGITDPLGRDPAVSAADNMALHVAQRMIETRWKVCNCARNSERGRRCFIDGRRKHWPITPSALAQWKQKLVYDRATIEDPPTEFFENVTARPRGSFAATPAGQAIAASNSHPAHMAADDSADASNVWTDTSRGQDSMDASTESTGYALGEITNTMTLGASKRLPPLMTVYHYTQTFQPGCGGLVLKLFKHDITYMDNLQRVFSGQARVQPEDLGLSASQLDVCDAWLVQWRSLDSEHAQRGEDARKDVEHLLAATHHENRDVREASTSATAGGGA